MSTVAACSRSPVALSSRPDAAEREKLERDRRRGVCPLERLRKLRCASSTSPSASVAKPIRQRAAIVPHRWLTSLKAS